MKTEEIESKRIRLESELSQQSAVSTRTDITDISVESRDTSDTNKVSNTNINDCVTSKPSDMNRQRKRTRSSSGSDEKSRKVLWSISSVDDNETRRKSGFETGEDSVFSTKQPGNRFDWSVRRPEFQNQTSSSNSAFRNTSSNSTNSFQSRRYDNNVPKPPQFGQRKRCVTESVIDERIDSYPQYVPRSYTTPNLNDGPQDRARRADIENLIYQYDQNKLHNNRRSQSVTSLQCDHRICQPPLPQPPDQMHQRDRRYSYNPVQRETIVDATGHVYVDHSYITPQSGSRSQSVTDVNQVPRDHILSIQSNDGSAYEQIAGTNINNKTVKSTCRLRSKFYKKCFYVLLVLNVLLLLLNSIGLPFAFVTTRLEPGWESLCLTCDTLVQNDGIDLEKNNVVVDGDRCCFESNDQLFDMMIKNQAGRAPLPPGHFNGAPDPGGKANQPLLHITAEKYAQTSDSIKSRIVWKQRADVSRNVIISDFKNTEVTINKTGYYFVYSRVSFRRDKSDDDAFTIGHNLARISKSTGKTKDIGSTIQRCFPDPNGVNGDAIVHSSTMQFIQHLDVGDIIFVTIDKVKYFDKENTSLGMFYLTA